MAVAPAPDDGFSSPVAAVKTASIVPVRDAARNEEDDDVQEKVDQIERVLGNYMFSEQGMSVEQAFKYHDKDSDEGISEEELKLILKKAKCPFTENEFRTLMARYDLDNSGSITVQEFQMTYRVKRTALLEFVTLKDDQRAACGQIPMTVTFFVILLLLVAMHDLTPLKYETESGMSKEILSNSYNKVKFSTISNTKDYWNWLEHVLVPQAFVQTDASTNKKLDRKDWGFVSRYNKFVGRGVEISQSRSKSRSCLNTELDHVYGHDCKPKNLLDNQEFGLPICTADAKQCWTPADGNSLEDYMNKYDDGFRAVDSTCKYVMCTDRQANNAHYVFSLDFLRSQDTLKTQLKYYRDRQWIDEQTTQVIITIATYNAEHGIFAQLILTTEFHRGGGVSNTWASESILSDPYGLMTGGHPTYQWVILLDALWVIMVCVLMISEFKEMKQLRIKYCHDPWNVLDWIQCLLTIAIECYWVYIVVRTYNLVSEYAESHDAKMLEDDFTGLLATPARTEVGPKLNILLKNAIIYRYLTIVNILVLVIRFFKAFNVQPRLAVISKTISKSVPDLAHFLVIFLCLFLTFVMFAHFGFGHIVYNYSTVDLAAFNTFRGFVAAPAINVPEIVQTNAFEWIPQREWVFPLAEVWWIMFMVLLFLVVRSILLAIVLESYKEAKLGSKNATTMWGQAYDMIRDIISGFRGVIRLRDVIAVLKKNLESRDRINMDMIVNAYAKNLEENPKKKNINFVESKTFILGLVKEFFTFVEVRLPAQDKLRALSAFARISELDGNFNDVCSRIDSLESKFDEIHKILTDLKARN